MRRKKICMVTTFHRPDDTRIYHKEARSLQAHYDTVIIAPDETKSDHTGINTTYDNAGVKIITIPKPEGLLRSLVAFRQQILRAAVRENCDVYHCHEPDSLLISMLIKVFHQKKVIYDVHEHWPSALMHMATSQKYASFLQKDPTSRIFQALVKRIEQILARRTDGIVVVSESVGERFHDNGVSTTIIPNVPIQKLKPEPGPEREAHNLIYMGGNLGYVHGVDLCGDLLSALCPECPGLSLTFVGKLDDQASKLPFLKKHADRITITGRLPLDRMYREIARGQVGLLLFRNTHHNMYIGLPSKLFDYMGCGIPVVASAFPEIQKVIETAQCGICVDPENSDAITAAVRYLLKNPTEAEKMGKNGSTFVSNQYNWNTVEEDLKHIYSTVIGAGNV